MMELECDIAVVGSGAGGGVVAKELAPLAKKGLRILLLESGPYATREYFDQTEENMTRLYWDRGGTQTKDGAMTIAQGRCVGGSTTFFTGTTFRIPQHVLDKWNIPDLALADLNPRYQRIEEELSVHELTDEYINANNRYFKKGMDGLGWSGGPLKINTSKACKPYGYCNLGCASGGKQGTMEVQIPKAVSLGVELVPNCHVTKVGERELWARISSAPKGTHPNHHPQGDYHIKARVIYVCAGAVRSPALLLKSGLAAPSPVLGRRLTFHPAMIVYGIHPEEIDGVRGFPKAYYCDEFSKRDRFLLETCFYYPFVAAKNIGAWGEEEKEIMASYRRLMAILILHHDETHAHNRIAVGGEKFAVHYRIDADMIRSLTLAQIASAEIFFEAGCEQVVIPASDKLIVHRDERHKLKEYVSEKNMILNKVTLTSAHPQGGCGMGQDVAHSVVNSYGQVHGHPWLFVMDASVYPQCVEVNPYLTIMALADRSAEFARENIESLLR
ncbi:MAG: GMC family oxidoreductase [Deltaproteobacteria bacterium]|nr:GMC family oxidoreductase [Deltaproteobacteria bacterium]